MRIQHLRAFWRNLQVRRGRFRRMTHQHGAQRVHCRTGDHQGCRIVARSHARSKVYLDALRAIPGDLHAAGRVGREIRRAATRKADINVERQRGQVRDRYRLRCGVTRVGGKVQLARGCDGNRCCAC